MKKKYVPQIRIISVEHDKTIAAEKMFAQALAKYNVHVPVRSVFCHLEAGRCGIESGRVALEIDGMIIWADKALSMEIAEKIASRIPQYIQSQGV